jgi:hypothetical protein
MGTERSTRRTAAQLAVWVGMLAAATYVPSMVNFQSNLQLLSYEWADRVRYPLNYLYPIAMLGVWAAALVTLAGGAIFVAFRGRGWWLFCAGSVLAATSAATGMAPEIRRLIIDVMANGLIYTLHGEIRFVNTVFQVLLYLLTFFLVWEGRRAA